MLALCGCRRAGKTRLLVEWLKRRDDYRWCSLAIEEPGNTQLQRLFEDIRSRLQISVVPKIWSELFELLRLHRGRWMLRADEFPCLVAADRALPSRVRRWLDHGPPAGCALVLAGSSTRMMHGLFLPLDAPLFGRARRLIQIQPMSYAAFCAACRLKAGDMGSFLKFRPVGGVLRIERATSDATTFKHRRKAEPRRSAGPGVNPGGAESGGAKKWPPMRKTFYSLGAVAAATGARNRRCLAHLRQFENLDR